MTVRQAHDEGQNNEALIAAAKADIVFILGNSAKRSPRAMADAIEALIDAKLAQALDQLSDRIEAAIGVRP